MPSKKHPWLVALFALLLICLPAVARARAHRPDPLRSSQVRLEQIHQKLAATRQKVRILKKREHVAVDQLTVLQQRLERTNIALEDSQFRLQRAKKQLEVTKVALSDARGRFAREQQLAGGRLRAIYKHRQTDYWEALLTSPDLVGFMTRYQYFKHITQSDAQLLSRLDQRMADIDHQKHRYGQTLQTISTITSNIAVQKDQIQGDTVDQAETLARIRSERASAEAAEAQMERDEAQIASMIRRLMAARRHMPRMGTGRFIMPINAPIGDGFGLRFHPILHIMRPHKGLDFRAHAGTPIHAVDRGVVIFSGWFGSFGKVVIIDHGGDVTTLYAHASRLVAEKGQLVQRGQLIAYSGSTGLSTGPHLHFEVHVNGTAVNPLPYLR